MTLSIIETGLITFICMSSILLLWSVIGQLTIELVELMVIAFILSVFTFILVSGLLVFFGKL